jgi:hypothetical protein
MGVHVDPTLAPMELSRQFTVTTLAASQVP